MSFKDLIEEFERSVEAFAADSVSVEQEMDSGGFIMTLNTQDLELIRRIIREELRREATGATCPECGDTQMSAAEFDAFLRETDHDEWSCWCGYTAPVEAFDSVGSLMDR